MLLVLALYPPPASTSTRLKSEPSSLSEEIWIKAKRLLCFPSPILFSACHKLLSLSTFEKHREGWKESYRSNKHPQPGICFILPNAFPPQTPLFKGWIKQFFLNILCWCFFFFSYSLLFMRQVAGTRQCCLLWPSLEKICFHILYSAEDKLFWGFSFCPFEIWELTALAELTPIPNAFFILFSLL